MWSVTGRCYLLVLDSHSTHNNIAARSSRHGLAPHQCLHAPTCASHPASPHLGLAPHECHAMPSMPRSQMQCPAHKFAPTCTSHPASPQPSSSSRWHRSWAAAGSERGWADWREGECAGAMLPQMQVRSALAAAIGVRHSISSCGHKPQSKMAWRLPATIHAAPGSGISGGPRPPASPPQYPWVPPAGQAETAVYEQVMAQQGSLSMSGQGWTERRK